MSSSLISDQSEDSTRAVHRAHESKFTSCNGTCSDGPVNKKLTLVAWTANRRHATIWDDNGPVYWHMHASLGICGFIVIKLGSYIHTLEINGFMLSRTWRWMNLNSGSVAISNSNLAKSRSPIIFISVAESFWNRPAGLCPKSQAIKSRSKEVSRDLSFVKLWDSEGNSMSILISFTVEI